MQLIVMLPAMQPFVPAVRDQHEVKRLQPRVRVESRLPENPAVQDDADHSGGPAPDVLAHGEPHAVGGNHRGEDFEPAHKLPLAVGCWPFAVSLGQR